MKKLKKQQREQVVELLLCAADYSNGAFGVVGLGAAQKYLDLPDEIWDLAHEARHDAYYGWESDYRVTCLEAARRIEEGTWP